MALCPDQCFSRRKTIVDKLAAAIKDISMNNADYQKDIAEGFSQTPVFYTAEEMAERYAVSEEMLKNYAL